MADDTNTVHRVAVLGYRILQGGSLGVAITPEATATQLKPQECLFPAKKEFRHLTIGGIYEVSGNAELTSVVVSQARYIKMMADQDIYTRWRITSDANRTEYLMRKDEKLQARRDLIGRVLAPIRMEYNRAPSIQRRIIEVMVLSALRSERV